MIHELHLDPAPFLAIAEGRKTVEMRLFDEKRRAIAVGDTLFIRERGGVRTLLAVVVALHRYADFPSLYRALPHTALGYPAGAVGDPADMEAYYPLSEQKAYGALGIEIKCKQNLAHH